MESRQKIVIFLVAIAIVGIASYVLFGKREMRKPIELNNKNQSLNVSTGPANSGDVSPISGLPCADWNRRPVAVMQPADVPARPAAGFSDADMVVEMPVITASVTRLMAVYVCGNPDDVGSMRSSRHDFISLAKGLDAIYVSWGGSHFAKEKLNEGVIDNMNCNNDGGKSAAQYCYRKEVGKDGIVRGVDTGYAKFAKLLEGAKDFGYRLENKFSGYKHAPEVALENRPKGGHLRVAFAGPFAAEYDYDRDTNSYLRTWGNVPDIDRNNKKRNAPKNVIVLMAQSEQIEGQYNNVQLGDPWYDTTDSGDAFYYMNGEQKRGTWKKDKSDIQSKLNFFDESGNEVTFVPGQMWVEVLEPGQTLRWEPVN
ncbi:MAG: DUF3048 domain-containing protein [Candidatus Moranbacteria bacterium]|nr:DUF3048 domain-containing protein [Candidatus Moranbacteria bacterium]